MRSSRAISTTWLALGREATTAAEHIAFGVTALGRANYAQDAYYIQAFVSLSMVCARSAKLALLIDHALDNNGRFPSSETLRGHGHDLARLLRAMDEIGARRGVAEKRQTSPIHEGIVRTLSEFATNVTRYYNLEVVSGDKAAVRRGDPIANWYRRVTTPILAAHYKDRYRKEDEGRAAAIDDMIGEFTSVLHTAETGEPIDSVSAASTRTATTEFARRWERVYVLQIARFVSEVLIELSHASHSAGMEVPFFSEIFGMFRNDDAYFRSRRSWSLYRH
jgi:hypothetical protein